MSVLTCSLIAARGWRRLVRSIGALACVAAMLGACGLAGGPAVSGWPDVDLDADRVEVYSRPPQRDLHLHVFTPSDTTEPAAAVLFFHGGGFRTTRVEQFAPQARLVADAGMVGIVVEYRVTSEGTSRADAVGDGADAYDAIVDMHALLGVDPDRIAMAGSSAGGALAVEAGEKADALVLFNPAVGPGNAVYVADQPTLVFHSRADTVIPFADAQSFCDALADCELVAFDEGDHGFFNDEPAFTETTTATIEFLTEIGF